MDKFAASSGGLEAPATNAASLAKNDAADIEFATRAIWVGAAGDAKVTMLGGQVVTFKAMNVGYHPLRIVRLWSTGTVAADIVGLW